MILFIARLVPRLRTCSKIWLPVLSLALAALLLTSAIWSAVPGLDNIAADLPAAGPTQSGVGGSPGGLSANGGRGNANNGLNVDTALVRYLETNRNGAQYLVAVASSNEADSLILATNQPVMALGSFSGSDPILTASQLAALVARGSVRFFLLGGRGGSGDQSSLTSWVTQHCTTVSSSQWQVTTTSADRNGFGGNSSLYDCKLTK